MDAVWSARCRSVRDPRLRRRLSPGGRAAPSRTRSRRRTISTSSRGVSRSDPESYSRRSRKHSMRTSADVLVDYTHAAVVKHNVLDGGRSQACTSSSARAGCRRPTTTRSMRWRERWCRRRRGRQLLAHCGVAPALRGRCGTPPRCLGGHRLRKREQAGRTEWHVARGRRAARRRAPSGVRVPLDEVHGPCEARGATIAGTQVHSVRLPSFVVSTEMVFAADGERLSIRHDAGETPAPYVAGTLLAVRAVAGRVGLTRGLDRLLDSVASCASRGPVCRPSRSPRSTSHPAQGRDAHRLLGSC